MTCARSFPISAALGAALLATSLARPLSAQPPVPTPSTSPSVLAPYRAPVIAMVQPAMSAAGGGTVPQDRPVVVFRFAAGEPDDPLDARSLMVAVDGANRTALFQATATQAWGALADEAALARGELPAGLHRVAARVCSTRGACATTEVHVLVVPGAVEQKATSADGAHTSVSKRRRVMRAVLSAAGKLLGE